MGKPLEPCVLWEHTYDWLVGPLASATWFWLSSATGIFDYVGEWVLGPEEWAYAKTGIQIVAGSLLLFAFIGILATCKTVCDWVLWLPRTVWGLVRLALKVTIRCARLGWATCRNRPMIFRRREQVPTGPTGTGPAKVLGPGETDPAGIPIW